MLLKHYHTYTCVGSDGVTERERTDKSDEPDKAITVGRREVCEERARRGCALNMGKDEARWRECVWEMQEREEQSAEVEQTNLSFLPDNMSVLTATRAVTL